VSRCFCFCWGALGVCWICAVSELEAGIRVGLSWTGSTSTWVSSSFQEWALALGVCTGRFGE